MNDKMTELMNFSKTFWTEKTKKQKGMLIGSSIIVVLLIVAISFLVTKKSFVPLYNDLSVQETSQIKEQLDSQGIAYQIEDGGTTVTVPEDNVESLLVELAGEGIPQSGSIDYSFFSDNASWGITDNEFNIMKLDAMQTELANLMKGIEGIDEARVMINMPEDTIFVNDTMDSASASIVLDTDPGFEFKGNQVESLYHLVSKAVPNLPEENIVIMNQYFEYFDRSPSSTYGGIDDYTYQQTVKKDVEKDIQTRLQQMLGAMVGMENVIVSVTADVDFTKENRIEELVDPVDLENMEGIPVSIETVHETYTGNQADGGIPGTGEDDVANYQAVQGDEDGEYELVKETINNELNHIRKDIVESPYKVRDLGIQVAVDSVIDDSGEEVQLLSQQDQVTVEDGITSILNSIISTSIDKEYGEVTPEEKTSIVFQEFSGRTQLPETTTPVIPLWMYIVGAILLIAILLLIILLVRTRRSDGDAAGEEFAEFSMDTSDAIPEMEETPETEADIRKKQLELMAKEKPEEFAKLLRSWITDD